MFANTEAASACSWEGLDAQSPMAKTRRHLDYALLLILGLVASWQWLATGDESLCLLAARGALLIVAWWFSVLWHELGHAIAARAAGLDPYVILVGSGRTVLRLSCLGLTLDSGWFPGAGLTLLGPKRADHLSKRTALALVGGPLATLILVAGSLALLERLDPSTLGRLDFLASVLSGGYGGNTSPLFAPVGSALVVSNLLILTTAARPSLGRAATTGLGSDLSLVVGLISRRIRPPVAPEGWPEQRGFARSLALRQYGEAERIARALLRAEPQRLPLRVDYAKMLYLAGRYADVGNEFRLLLDARAGEGADRAERDNAALNNAAWNNAAWNNAAWNNAAWNNAALNLAAWIAERAHSVDAPPRLQAERLALEALIAPWRQDVV